MTNQTVGLILSGGGARAAYQVGVLRAIASMLAQRERNPFGIVCGTSGGAVNAASLASMAIGSIAPLRWVMSRAGVLEPNGACLAICYSNAATAGI